MQVAEVAFDRVREHEGIAAGHDNVDAQPMDGLSPEQRHVLCLTALHDVDGGDVIVHDAHFADVWQDGGHAELYSTDAGLVHETGNELVPCVRGFADSAVRGVRLEATLALTADAAAARAARGLEDVSAHDDGAESLLDLGGCVEAGTGDNGKREVVGVQKLAEHDDHLAVVEGDKLHELQGVAGGEVDGEASRERLVVKHERGSGEDMGLGKTPHDAQDEVADLAGYDEHVFYVHGAGGACLKGAEADGVDEGVVKGFCGDGCDFL